MNRIVYYKVKKEKAIVPFKLVIRAQWSRVTFRGLM